MTQNEPLRPITPKQRRLIQALLTNPTQLKACAEANVSRATLRRWLADPQFNKALIEAEGQSLKDATRMLLSGKEQALQVLSVLMTTADSENVRRQAANDWLAYMFRSYELQTLEERVSELEKAVRK